VLFITVEDETGVANIILWPDRFEAQRTVVMSSAMISIVGKVQREASESGGVIHVIADHIRDYTGMLRQVGDIDMPRLSRPGQRRLTGSRRAGLEAQAAQPLPSALPHGLRSGRGDSDPQP
jgi:error-prone DNA polymerase